MKEISLETLGSNPEWMKRLIFASVFIEANKLQTVFDNNSKEVSSKQWLLLVITASFDEPPSLSALGELMGCSRQNVKKLAVILEKKGFIELVKDQRDSRSLHVKLTKQAKDLDAKMHSMSGKVLESMFGDFTEEEVEQLYRGICKLANGIDRLPQVFKKEEE